MATEEVVEQQHEDPTPYAGVLRFYELAKRAEWQVRDLPWGEIPPIPETKGTPQKIARRPDLRRSAITHQLQAGELPCGTASPLPNMQRQAQGAGLAGRRPAWGRDPADPGDEGHAAEDRSPARPVAFRDHAAAPGGRARLRDGLPAPQHRARSRGEALLLDDGAGRVAPHRGVAAALRRDRRNG